MSFMSPFKQHFSFSFLVLFFVCVVMSCNDNKKSNGNTKVLINDSLASKETANPYTTHDLSPMDMSYYPSDYPVLKMNGTDTGALVARVIYSRPQKKGRNIFGTTERSLRQYGKEWRLGANEATEIEFFKPVIIGGKKVDKGRYIIYCIPYPDRWTIILNSNLYTWGLHMDRTKDIFKTDIPVSVQSPSVEDFTMVFTSAPYGTDLLISWDNVKAVLPISYSK